MKSPDTMYFMIATDNHLGFNEKDPVRGNDSFAAFEEILKLAKENDVDGILLSGDLFHDNKPSRKCIHTTMELLRHYCLGSRVNELELLSDPSVNFPGRFGTANYEDPNYNVSMPVFMIHGNHDDPTGEGNLSAVDILSTAGLVNYFGKSREVDDITMMPVLLKKGSTQLALYGLGNMRDERLHRTFLSHKVKMLAPPETGESPWFNLLLFHQNRVAHGATNYIPESFLDESLDLIIWGHEHDVQIEPVYVPQRDFYISQPGSSVVVSLSEGECNRPKTVAILEITGKTFQMKPIVLKCSRPFVMGDISLTSSQPPLNPLDLKSIERFLCAKIDDLIEKAKLEWIERQGPEYTGDASTIPLPLIRLKVDYSNGFSSFNPHRFGHLFVGKVANPKDVILFYRKRAPSTKPSSTAEQANKSVQPRISIRDEERGKFKMEDLVKDYLSVQNLGLFPQNEFGDSVKIFVEKDDKDSIEEFVKKSIDRICSSLQRQGSISSFDAPTLKGAISREKLQREIEWQRLHPGMDALLSHRRTNYADRPDDSDEDLENEEINSDITIDEDGFSLPQKRTTTTTKRGSSTASSRARGGRGRGHGTSSATALSMSTEVPKPVQPAASSKWPPRR